MMFAICAADHVPPLAVGTPRAASAEATSRRLVAPLALICSMIGLTLVANLSAAFRFAAWPKSRAAANFGPLLIGVDRKSLSSS
jgi:hypothetical protein